MSIVHRKNSFYVVRRDPVTKRQKWISCGRGIEGEQKAHELNDSLKAGGIIRPYHQQPQDMHSPTFATLANEYLKARRADLSKESMYCLYAKLKDAILPELGHLPATRITGRQIDQYVEKRARQPVCTRIKKKGCLRLVPICDQDGHPRTIKITTIHRELTIISAVLNWAADPVRGYIAINPVAGYKKPRRDDQIITPPSAAEAAAILAHLPEHARRALTISYYTGVRPGGELFGICWHDVDFVRKSLLIRSARKGGPADRRLPVNDALIAHLQKWHAEDEKIEGRRAEVILYRGERVRSIKRTFTHAKIKAGITRRLRMYDFRHSFATDLIDAGADTKAVSYMLGHSRPDTTARIYRHVSMEPLRDLVNRREDPLTKLLDEKSSKKNNDNEPMK